MSTKEVNTLVLAYFGDTIYEDYVRLYLIKQGINHVKQLQEQSRNYVSAKSQSQILKHLINENIFTDEELEVIKRGRNTKTNSHPKSVDIITYKEATALETLIGYLKLENKEERIQEIMNKIFNH